MSKRLQVLFDETELREIQRAARRRRMSVAEWVRQSLRNARASERDAEPAHKLEVIRVAAGHSYPTGEMTEMLADIERGSAGGDRS
jgi:hypothetical protein